MLAILTVFRLTKGRIPIEGGRSGRTILRFNVLERGNHWMVASTFIILALSGLNLTFGRHILLPIVGPEAFTAISQWGKYAHNFLAFPFMVGLVLMLLIWIGSLIMGLGGALSITDRRFRVATPAKARSPKGPQGSTGGPSPQPAE
jgi:formate dehydrogenase subunit gamma